MKKKLLVLAMAVITTLSMMGCGASTSGNDNADAQSQTAATVQSEEAADATTDAASGDKDKAAGVCYVTVEGYCTDKEIEISDGDTAYSALKATGASVDAKDSEYGLYVDGINGKFAGDEGAASGWMFSVNGTTPSVGANDYKLSGGEKVEWYYMK